MKLIADLQIHSRFSRATSSSINLANLEKYARLKGLNLLGTGDFTHPKWLAELKNELREDGSGILTSKTGFNFVLQGEISNIYTQDGKARRVHTLLLAKNFEIVEQINSALLKKGRLDYDGRPIFGFSCIELVEMMKEIDNGIEIIPAHCLLPGTVIHSNPKLVQIEQVKKGDYVLTHRGTYRSVKAIYNRYYKGIIYTIKPRYFTLGITTTKEHPFLAIKTFKDCSWTSGICKPTYPHIKRCVTSAYKNYKPEWIQARNLEVGDVLLYPRLMTTKDVDSINVGRYNVKVDKDFCRLVGYYLSEGYTNGRDCIGFSFNKKETEFVDDVVNLINKVFQLKHKKGKTSGDLLIYSNQLRLFFEKNFYDGNRKIASTKSMPSWILQLSLEKQVEILRSWWYGDRGSTSSRALMNQFKIICLRLGIVPSIRVDTKEAHERRGKHVLKDRIIRAKNDNYILDRLTFFEDKFGLLKDKYFKMLKPKKEMKYGWVDDGYVYLPILKIIKNDYKGSVYNIDVDKDNSYVSEFATIHNCWTPWYGIFGSMSGFDSVEECFKEKSKHIHAIETGLSCYDKETEVLTENGWKRFPDVSYSDKICTLNVDTDEIEFQKPLKIHKYKYKGKMYRLKTKRVDLLVTPNHNLLYAPCDFRDRKPYSLRTAQSLYGKSKILKKDANWSGKGPQYFTLPSVEMKHGSKYYSGLRTKPAKQLPMKSWLKFFGFWLAEGWVTNDKDGDYNICISNSNQLLLDEMNKLLKSFGYKPYQRSNLVRVRDYQLYNYLKQFGKASEKFVPLEVKVLSKGLLNIFFEYYIKGDGHIYGRNRKGLSATTISTRLRDDLQEIALKIGISAYYKLHYKKGTYFSSPSQKKKYKQSADSWVIFFIRKNKPIILPSTIKKYNHIEAWVNYKGWVYCVNVPNNTLYIRRKGIPIWCGNSDPAMNWRLSSLDKYTLVSSSDAHSFWPWRLGREANVFDIELSYDNLLNAIRTRKGFVETIEMWPHEGKYHYSGHRNCNVCLSPKESLKLKNICPKCGRKLTVGVAERVEELADRPEGFVPKNAVPFKNLIPLSEVIAGTIRERVESKKVWEEYYKLVNSFGNEFNVVLEAEHNELKKITSEKIAENIIRNRFQKIPFKPGYDGVYGVPIFDENGLKESKEEIGNIKPKTWQKGLDEFF